MWIPTVEIVIIVEATDIRTNDDELCNFNGWYFFSRIWGRRFFPCSHIQWQSYIVTVGLHTILLKRKQCCSRYIRLKKTRPLRAYCILNDKTKTKRANKKQYFTCALVEMYLPLAIKSIIGTIYFLWALCEYDLQFILFMLFKSMMTPGVSKKAWTLRLPQIKPFNQRFPKYFGIQFIARQ